MDLFALVQMADPKSVTVRTRELLPGETPILEATAGRVLDLVLEEETSDEVTPNPIHATPINVAAPRTESAGVEGSGSSASIQLVDIVDTAATTAAAAVQGTEDRKRKRIVVEDDGATTSRGKRPAVSASGNIPEQAGVAEPVAPMSEPEARVTMMGGASAVAAPTVAAKAPPST